MADDRDRQQVWDERFARGEHLYDYVPSPPLPEAVDGVVPGRALDLAAGAGRHALYLAERGWEVVAIDGSRVGLERMTAEADRRGLTGIEPRVADLEAPGFALTESFDLVLDFYFFHPPLFDRLRTAVRPGGLLVAAIHVVSDDVPHRYRMQRGQLEATVRGWGWHVLFVAEGDTREPGHHDATAEIIARRPG